MSSQLESIETDVLIIGGGMAGLSAAVAISNQTEVKCVIVEKSDKLGGSSALSAGMFWAPKDVQAALSTIHHADPKLLTKFISEYPSAVQWMKENGVKAHEQFNGIMTIGIGFPIDIPQWLDRAESIIRSIPTARIMTQTSAIQLLQSTPNVPGSRVVGAILRSSDGTLTNCLARAVVIATGGFQGNPQLVSRHLGPGADNIFVRSNPHSTGDGFQLGSRAGAGTSRGLSTFYGHLLPSPLHRRDVDSSHFIHLAQFQSGYSVLVNSAGRRFCDETFGDEVNNQELARQPGRIGYMILNEETRKRWALGEVFPNAGRIDRLEKAKAFGGRVTSAESINQLLQRVAQWGVPEDALQETIISYNKAIKERAAQTMDISVGNNHDPHPPLEGEGPFWALEVQPSITFSYGGLRIDTSARVIDTDGRPIPGLYACGMDAGGFSNWRYGGGLAQAFVTGRWAASGALDELKDVAPVHARL